MTWLLFLSVHPAQAQSPVRVQGVVLDPGGEPLGGATIRLYAFRGGEGADSLATSSGPEGAFRFKPVRADSVRLRVTFIGFEAFEQTYRIEAAAQTPVELPAIRLQPVTTDLDEALVEAARPELEVKGDTLAFTAATFPVRPGATVGDLLQRLPGVEIDEQGNITFNGKRVTRLMIEGREYFGGDPALASGTIPADIIDKVEIMDTRTREQEFTGQRPDGETKTLNLTLREDAPKVFGKAGGGYGSDERYDASGTLNYIDGPTQASLLGYGNNVNKVIYQRGNQTQSATVSNAGTGITDTQSGGLNASHQWESGTEATGSYLFDQSASGQATSRQRRQNVLADSTFLQVTRGDLEDDTRSHRLNLNLRFIPDSTSQILIRPSANLQEFTRQSIREDVTSTPGGVPLNEGESLSRSSGESERAGLSLFYGKRLGRPGRSLTISGSGNWNGQHSDDLNQSTHTFYSGDTPDSTAAIDQRTLRETTSGSWSLATSWNEPLDEHIRLRLGYSVSRSRSVSDQDAFSYNPATGGYTIPDSAFTNRLESVTLTHTPSARLSLDLPEVGLGIDAGASLFATTLDHDNSALSEPLRLRQLNVGPRVNVNYQLAENKHLSLNFSARTRSPTPNQLQPAPDNTNPLRVRRGNPNLKPAFSQNYRISYNAYHVDTGNSVFANVSFAPTTGSIVPAVTYESGGRQVISYANADGVYYLNGRLNYSRRVILGEHRLRASAEISGSFNNSVSILDQTQSETRTASLGPSLTVNYSLGEWVILATTWRPDYQWVRYSQYRQRAGGLPDEYIRHQLSNSLTVQWPKNIRLESDLNYRYDGGLPAGFQRNTVLWNAALAWRVVPKGELKISGYDLLGQNTNLYRTTGEHYIEDVQTTILQRYLLLSFSWDLGDRGETQ